MTGEWVEIIKSAAPPLLAVALAGLVGHKLSTNWALYQKQKEREQDSTETFYKLYGEFFSTWKYWNYVQTHSSDQNRIDDAFDRSTKSEGLVESFLVRMCIEYKLDDSHIATLGRFRQAYQTLRQTIRDNKNLDWGRSSHKEYLAFKRLSVEVARLASGRAGLGRGPDPEEAKHQLERVTSNDWESIWSS